MATWYSILNEWFITYIDLTFCCVSTCLQYKTFENYGKGDTARNKQFLHPSKHFLSF